MYKGTTDFTGVPTNDSLQLSDSSIDLYINKLNKTYTSPSDIFPTYYIIQLKKFADKIRDKFDEWVYLLKHESIKSGFNAQGILSAKEKLDVLKLSAKDRQAYDKYWQNMSFEASLVETHQVELEQAARLGKTEGIELGRQNAQQEIALQLLKSGVDKVIVAKSTNLTLIQIDELLKDIN